MMRVLLDTNVLLRLADDTSPEHSIAKAAVARMFADNVALFISTADFPRSWGVEAAHPRQFAIMPTN